MLKQDFNGYKDFIEKVMNTSGEEAGKACVERTQMWCDKIVDVVTPLPYGDVPCVITALEIVAGGLRNSNTEACKVADKLKSKIAAICETMVMKGDENTTEAAVRAYAETLRKK